jgi:hypothetical protein
MEIVAIVGLPNFDTDWQKSISEYLWLKTMQDDKTKTRCLVRWANGYLIHDDELYHHNTPDIF